MTAPAALAQSSPDKPARLVRADDSSTAVLRSDARIGEIVVSYYERLQRKYGERFSQLDESLICPQGPTQMLRATAKSAMGRRDAATRDAIRHGDAVALRSLAIDLVSTLDGVAAMAIEADEAIGPGAYHPSITAITETIARCHLY